MFWRSHLSESASMTIVDVRVFPGQAAVLKAVLQMKTTVATTKGERQDSQTLRS